LEECDQYVHLCTFICGRRPNCSFMLTGGETQRPSVFMLPPVEHTRTETVTLTCYVKDFFPHEVFVSWLAASDSKYKFSTTNPVKNNGSYSAYGQLSLGLDEWKNNNMVYSCVVYHQSVQVTVTIIKCSMHHIGIHRKTLCITPH
uniref:Ig-like domain-containing protein n=1 Tax=Seriola dumerili TaxID=41447 RepID=A0A3B4TLV8_SERDU